MPSKIDPMVYRLHACTPEYKQKHARLFYDLRRQIDSTCYVSFSAGKDSAVCAHACNLVLPGIPILSSDSGCPMRWLEEERKQWQSYADDQGWNYRLFPWNKWGKKVIEATEDVIEYRKIIHASMFSELNQWATENGYTRRIWGIRKDESIARKIRSGVDGDHCQARLAPIRDWSTNDVWAYIVTHGIPWLSIYDYLGPTARNGLIGIGGSENGRLAFLKKYYPDVYRQARQLFNADDLR
jgi:3'-phosphoadenosine 5'-phosphosulfate sulfotransferase (PAPS reductase)/FAD synthetase